MENQKKDRSKGGRRPLPKAEKKSETISFHCDQMTKMMIKKKVERSHLAMRDFIQQALENAEITPAECQGYFDMVDRFTVSDLCNLVVVSAKVVSPLTKEEVKHIYVGVRNGATFKNLGTLEYVKDAAVTGKKDAPYAVQTMDYNYTDGDELWIYSDGSVNLFAIQFDGKIDSNFAGSEPMAVVKAVKKARK